MKCWTEEKSSIIRERKSRKKKNSFFQERKEEEEITSRECANMTFHQRYCFDGSPLRCQGLTTNQINSDLSHNMNSYFYDEI